MSVAKTIARETTIHVWDASAGTPAYVELDYTDFQFSVEPTSKPVTTRADQGWTSELVIERKASLTVNSVYMCDLETGDRNRAQEICEAEYASFGYDAFIKVKVTEPSGQTWVWESAQPTATPVTGGQGDEAKWTCVFSLNGAPVVTAP